jgi:hypothetical protein
MGTKLSDRLQTYIDEHWDRRDAAGVKLILMNEHAMAALVRQALEMERDLSRHQRMP